MNCGNAKLGSIETTHVERTPEEPVPKESPREAMLHAGSIILDEHRWRAWVDDVPMHLTRREFELLRELLRADGRTLTRSWLLENVWEKNQQMETRTVDVHIRFLRRKIGTEKWRIETVREVGYRLNQARTVPRS